MDTVLAKLSPMQCLFSFILPYILRHKKLHKNIWCWLGQIYQSFTKK